MTRRTPTSSRRQFLAAASGAAAALVARPVQAQPQRQADPEALQAAIRKVVGGATVKPGKVKLEVPPLSENGNSVSISVTVDHPMTPENHVKAIHVFTEKNPQPNVISVQLGARAGRAGVATRMRLADTQDIVAIAELSDGTFWSDSAHVIITLGACLEDNLI